MEYHRYVSASLLLLFLIVLAVEGLSVGTRMVCETLPSTSCAFAVDSHGARCVLETSLGEDGGKVYQCQTSELQSYSSEQYLENDDCVKACGVDRMTVGISTDEFLLPGFAESLCSLECQMECVNIVDLFSSIVASVGKDASLGKFCNQFLASQGHRRQMRANQFNNLELASLNGISPTSSSAAEGPTDSIEAQAPTDVFSASCIPETDPFAPVCNPGSVGGGGLAHEESIRGV